MVSDQCLTYFCFMLAVRCSKYYHNMDLFWHYYSCIPSMLWRRFIWTILQYLSHFICLWVKPDIFNHLSLNRAAVVFLYSTGKTIINLIIVKPKKNIVLTLIMYVPKQFIIMTIFVTSKKMCYCLQWEKRPLSVLFEIPPDLHVAQHRGLMP